MNALSDALVIVARAALAMLLAAGLVAFALYAAGSRISHWLHGDFSPN